MFVFPRFNRTGLCNMLFPWARAVAYCHAHGLKMMAPQWTDFKRLGPWLRGERDKRYYLNQFMNEGYVSNWFGLRPKISSAKIFSGMDGYFDPFIDSQELIRQELWKIVNPRFAKAAKAIGEERFIGCHVRRGDFVTNGQCLADGWYIAAIKKARQLFGVLPVKIFSDSSEDKLRSITEEIDDSVVMPESAAIQDLLALSLSQVCVCTPCSTYSMWAVFLGQMPSIWAESHPLPPRIYADEEVHKLIVIGEDLSAES